MKISRIINSIFTSNTFILTNDDSPYCWLVDVGDEKPILDAIGKKYIKGILLTHTHYDHIYGINKIIERFPDCIVYTSEAGKEGLYSDKFNFSRYHSDPIIFKGKKIQLLKDGEYIELFPNLKIKSFFTPGHDMSCVSYYTDNEIFTGDSYIPNIKVITSFPRSSKEDANVSLELIMKLIENRSIYPGHNDCYIKK